MNKFIIKSLAILLSVSAPALAQQKQAFKTVGGKQVKLHKVAAKETWSALSRQYNLSIDELKGVNPGINDLKTGQIINVPLLPAKDINENVKEVKEAKEESFVTPIQKPSTSALGKTKQHTVAKGETLFGLAKKYNVKPDDLKAWNNLKDSGLKLGQVLKIKNTEAAPITVEPKQELKKEAQVNTQVIPTSPAIAKEEKKPEIKQVAENKISAPSPVYADAGNKIIPVNPAKEEVAYIPAKKESRKSGKEGNIVEMMETGMASWLKDGDINQSKFYALHRSAPSGTIIKVTNRMNGDYVFVKVVGQLPDTGDNDKQIVKISEAAAKRIGAINEKFQVELNYGLMQ